MVTLVALTVHNIMLKVASAISGLAGKQNKTKKNKRPEIGDDGALIFYMSDLVTDAALMLIRTAVNSLAECNRA